MIYVKTTGIEIYPGISWDNLITFIVSIMTFLIVIGAFTLGKLYYDKVKQPLISKTVLLGWLWNKNKCIYHKIILANYKFQ